MPASRDQIEAFLRLVGRRLNMRRLAATAVWAVIAASLVLLVAGASYIARGHAFDLRWYGAAALAAGAATLLAWVVRLARRESSARFADRHFGLKDALVSSLHFARDGKREGFYTLQQEQTAQRVAGLDAEAIDWRPSQRPLAAACCLAVLAIAPALPPTSQTVLDRIALEEQTLELSERSNQELKELVRELNEQVADPLEREMIEPDKLREMVESLEKTSDQKAALRQYARLEKQIQEQLTKLSQRRDEQLMSEAAVELAKDRATRPLAEELAKKKYDASAEHLEQMKPTKTPKLSEQQKEVARLEAAAKRMAAAVRNQRGRGASGGSSPSSKSGESAGASGSSSGKGGSADGSGGSGGGAMGDAIEDLEASLSKWSESLREASRQEKQHGKCDAKTAGECKECRSKSLSDLNSLKKCLTRMAIKKKACDKLGGLCKACSRCQGGMCQGAMCQSPKAGGKKAGTGSNLALRNERDTLLDNGQTETLKGVKSGDGPSQTTVETAEEGTGVSGRAAVAQRREFRRQFESFVSREDVPEELRTGVKEYFESIHIDAQSPVEESR
ncbi:hypothetical protein Mal64_05770 [Pseudobythopirellula maris]|uniref:Uncharacterized protein n=1 Tax=Pseudobythopirellula maris TaxID=2527991 RepID=A0A5C5ZVE9_9BACT|nr:hypothetical protein [Pseudobythopirellula maris]TWT90193.1 hypothetical protein Mal64_05770 [Pseudobythopirellula maris]